MRCGWWSVQMSRIRLQETKQLGNPSGNPHRPHSGTWLGRQAALQSPSSSQVAGVSIADDLQLVAAATSHTPNEESVITAKRRDWRKRLGGRRSHRPSGSPSQNINPAGVIPLSAFALDGLRSDWRNTLDKDCHCQVLSCLCTSHTLTGSHIYYQRLGRLHFAHRPVPRWQVTQPRR